MNDGATRPTDIDPRRFHRALITYFVVALLAVTGWQVWRYSNEVSERERARLSETAITEDLAVVAAAASRYQEDHGRPPRNFAELLESPSVGGKPYLERVPNDPWLGRPYRFLANRERFVVFTYGRDGVEGGEGYDRDRYSSEVLSTESK